MKKEFAELKKDFAKLEKTTFIPNEENKVYWNLHRAFTEKLRKFLYLEFTELSKPNFLWLCDRVSSFRPVEPFSFLVSISNRKSKKA